jgi:hypothetical protein
MNFLRIINDLQFLDFENGSGAISLILNQYDLKVVIHLRSFIWCDTQNHFMIHEMWIIFP